MKDSRVVRVRDIDGHILLLRGSRVMLDSVLASLYGVETKDLKRAVKRNAKRFPADFMFQLTGGEYRSLRCQFGTLKRGAHAKYLPCAFTEQGVAMLSSVLHSEKAIQINVAIMRAFVKIREAVAAHKELAQKLAELEGRIAGHDENIQTLFEAIRQLMTPPEPAPKQIGFHVKEDRAVYGRRRVRRK
jgi:hypothetical protein